MKTRIRILAVICLLTACTSTKKNMSALKDFPASFYKEGHRGTRGLMPENTIPSSAAMGSDDQRKPSVDFQRTTDAGGKGA